MAHFVPNVAVLKSWCRRKTTWK